MFFNFILFLGLFVNGFYVERYNDVIIVDVKEKMNMTGSVLSIKFVNGKHLTMTCRPRLLKDGVAVFKLKKKEIDYFNNKVKLIRIQKNDFVREARWQNGECLDSR